MKFCNRCGEEIDGKDGENHCPSCEEDIANSRRNTRAKANRKAREEALRSLGLVKVRGALGGTYWE